MTDNVKLQLAELRNLNEDWLALLEHLIEHVEKGELARKWTTHLQQDALHIHGKLHDRVTVRRDFDEAWFENHAERLTAELEGEKAPDTSGKKFRNFRSSELIREDFEYHLHNCLRDSTEAADVADAILTSRDLPSQEKH